MQWREDGGLVDWRVVLCRAAHDSAGCKINVPIT